MALEAGARLGPYEVIALVAAGETGDLYKATDTRLDRTIALKTLPPDGADPQITERLALEAQALAALGHPNICPLLDVGRERPAGDEAADEIGFVVTEFVEGQTLAKRLERGALRLSEAVKIAIAITDALDKAHQKGVVHRHLKPSNVMLTESGVKLLDFGVSNGSVVASATANAARTTRVDASILSSIKGPLEYMAPEQLEGAEADARTDIFSFGAIFHEMVTGTKAFEGKNRPLLVAAIATLDLDPLSKTQPATPPALDHVAKRCLAKNPDDRWQTAHDLNLQLRWIAEGAGKLGGAIPGKERRVLVALATAALLVTVLAAPALLYFRGSAPQEAFQFRVPVYGINPSDISVSPNGELMAFVARPDPPESSALYVRPVNTMAFRRVAGTDDAALPFWSPDSRSVAFVAGGRLKKIDASGGPPQNIAETTNFTGGTWNRDGTIVFGSPKGLLKVSAEGGTPEAITAVEKPETGHYWPSFLPDGRHFTYLAWGPDAASRALFLGTLDSKEKKKLMAADSNATYASSTGSAQGYLVYHREATLFAQPWDANALALTGQPLHIADELAFNSTNGRGSFDVSQNGVLLYYQGQGGPSGRGGVQPNAQYGWRDRAGNQLGPAGEMGAFGDVDLSPDGKLFAVTRQESGSPGADIWVTDWQRGATTRLTLDAADDVNPVWSPDGLRVAFTTYRKGNADIYVKNANGTGGETALLETSNNEAIEDWSKDGRYIAYKLAQESTDDIYVLPLVGDKKPIPVVTGPFRKDEAQFSFDGKWIAYTSDESGAFQVYVIEFPGGKERHQISTNGGGQPRWRRDGKELYYRSPDNAVMVVDMTLGARIESSIPRGLFFAFNSVSSRDPVRHQTSVTPDGQRFLVRYPNGGAGPGAAAVGRGGGRGTGGAGVPFAFAATAGGAQGGFTGRGNAFSNNVPGGLTVIRNWPAAVQKQ